MATRNFAMTFDLSSNQNGDELSVNLSAITASYMAQGMNQHLPTSHLVGSKVNLLGDGRSFRSPDGGGEIPLGSITDGGLRPSALLAGMLPVLPQESVSDGMTWVSNRPVVSLEGWAWAGADMQHHHEIVDIQSSGGRSVVSVRSYGESAISSATGHVGFLGEGRLSQRFEWRFDSASGRLLSLSGESVAHGMNLLPQGEIPVRQIARYELLADG